MKIVSNFKDAWKNAGTAEKIGFVVDILCGVGSGLIGSDMGEAWSGGHGKLTSFCIKLVTFGGSVALGSVASKTIKDEYVGPLASLVDNAKKNEEDEENE